MPKKEDIERPSLDSTPRSGMSASFFVLVHRIGHLVPPEERPSKGAFSSQRQLVGSNRGKALHANNQNPDSIQKTGACAREVE